MHTIAINIQGSPLVADVYPAAGPSAEPPVLLIHGWGGSGRYWHGTAERLRAHSDVIVPDLPGVGRSLPARRAFDMEAHVAALETLLAQLHIPRVRLVGHSMGGGIAILLAARRPELVDRLVLTAISLFRNDAERTFFRAITEVSGALMHLRAPWMADLEMLRRQFAGRFFFRVPDDAELLRTGFLDYLQMDRDTAVASARSAADPAINAAARQVRAPTLLIVARQDQIMPPANVPFTQATIPGCDVRWFEECGHFPMIEHAEAYAAQVRNFLSAPARNERAAEPAEAIA